MHVILVFNYVILIKYSLQEKSFNRGYLVEVNITLGIDLINEGFF